eukprot:scaffold43068_cov21-Tisochrysis_lutea.AAC.1
MHPSFTHPCSAKALDKLEKAESEYNGLMSKRQIVDNDRQGETGTWRMSKRQAVDNDRQRILQVIEDLDDKKKVAMKDTWHKVGGLCFGARRKMLLFKLGGQGCIWRCVEGVPDRAEWRPALPLGFVAAVGTVQAWMMTEVTAGMHLWECNMTAGHMTLKAVFQHTKEFRSRADWRSWRLAYIALGDVAVLTTCVFQPAPLYILDEVDAALDLNHTQNIGSMIKAHFPQSQFIVVSLKVRTNVQHFIVMSPKVRANVQHFIAVSLKVRANVQHFNAVALV